MAERYEHLEKVMCKELERLDKKYAADVEMSEQDAERAERLYHALKSAETYHAMHDSREEMEGYSGDRRAGRNYSRAYPMPGRYYRDGGEGYSGHYPIMIDYPTSYARPDWGRPY